MRPEAGGGTLDIVRAGNNSSLVKRLRADNSTGLKLCTEAADVSRLRPRDVVGEHSECSEVRPRGLMERSEETLPAQVAIKQMRALLAVNLRIPEQG